MSETKGRTRNFGVLLSAVLLLSTGLAGCFEGYTGADGDSLLAYLAPADLQVLTQNPDPEHMAHRCPAQQLLCGWAHTHGALLPVD